MGNSSPVHDTSLCHKTNNHTLITLKQQTLRFPLTERKVRSAAVPSQANKLVKSSVSQTQNSGNYPKGTQQIKKSLFKKNQ